MKAAVLSSFDTPPLYADFAEPVASGRDEMLVEVLAVGLHHITLAKATGRHYSGTGALPLVPGVDGVGRGTDGKLRYFVLEDTRSGSLADRTVVQLDRSLVLSRDCDPIAIAAAMNPAMGAWLALRCRFPFKKKQKVLVLGATGSSGSMAVQIAHYLGASQVIAAGRDQQRLEKLSALGATDVVALEDRRLEVLAREVDVVLDFVWGECTGQLMERVVTARTDRNRPLTWIEIGSVAGPTAPIPAAVLRAAHFQLIGSGIGSVPGREIVKELPSLVKELARGTFKLDAKPMPLRDVEAAWLAAPRSPERIVLTP